ncbi:hypothetical protein GE09DRAFT_988414 [Coniochaeta sp. 2T2.1]|nr:hypothetical protein GE09DRAFT_988414 [Coniochaeta sp. 2T2.1]
MSDRSRTGRNWRGHGTGGRGGRGPGNASRQALRPCRNFQTRGACRFGASCKFSHERTGGDDAPRRQSVGESGASVHGDEEKLQYNQWKRLLWRRPSPRAAENTATLAEIWSGAVEILTSGSRESQQMLAKDLVSNDDDTYACKYIHLTLEVQLDSGLQTFPVVENFLRAITHASLLDSLSVDTYVGSLYNIISGARGDRAVSFFLDLSRSLSTSADPDPARLDRSLALILDALHVLLCREKRALFHDDLPQLFDHLDRLFGALDTNGLGPQQLRLSRRDVLGVLRRIVDLAKGLVKEVGSDVDGNTAQPLRLRSVFPLETQLPGGRHDNDDLDITRISIVPTSAEITSDQPDYLPSTDCRQPHFYEDQIQRYFDTHFRLLRYDVWGPLKSAIGPLMHAFQDEKPPTHLPGRDMNAHLYHNASIAHISVHEKRGFEIHIDFSLPHHLRQKSPDERGRWWDNSKRLEPGGLKCTNAGRGQNYVPKSNTASIVVKLARVQLEDLRLLIRVYHKKCHGVLVAIPGLIPATFYPILQNLQKMIGVGELPFNQYVVPGPNKPTGHPAASKPPRYALGPRFSFSLESIANKDGNPIVVTATDSPDDPDLISTLEQRTGLDAGQCRALVCALTREYALTQGPPGTGKSYLGVKLIQVLLDSKKDTDLGPIVIICYTNHALDQFLQHLLSVGIRKIIRIGGQSRAPELEGHNLRTVSENTARTKHEGYLLGTAYSEREEELKEAGKRLGTLHQLRKGLPWAALRRLIQRKHLGIYRQLIDDDVEGFQTVGAKDPLERWLGLGPKFRREDRNQRTADVSPVEDLAARASEDVDSLLPHERRALAEHWAEEIRQEDTERLFANIRVTEGLQASINSVHNEVNRRALLGADVVGITTTGLAKDVATLQRLRAKVVVCEEAAEVQEAHIISAMMPGIEHFIQIGDHDQLRPQINNYSLSLENSRGMLYQLDRSQFERLAVGEPGLPRMPVAQLNVQRRMRPEISRLIRNTMYPDLQDHASVLTLPDVVGMRENVFWLNHDNMEATANDDGRVKSHSNEWEVGMTKSLVRHLVRQGEYKSTDISVLTPYSGQLQALRSALSADFEICLSDRDEEALALGDFHSTGSEDTVTQGRLQKKGLIESLRLATVDNFQGEEAKIVIVSLVRSNPQQKPGFLRTKNRINVLLSRAQHGLYLIGNVDTYAGVPMWVDVRRQLDEVCAIGRAFNLCCPRHKETPIQCAEPDDFLLRSPEGGCLLPCDRRLDSCGHKCQAKCHSEAMHAVFFCPQPCPRVRLTCTHTCPKLCGESCGPCQVLVNQVQLPCGHKKDRVRCFETQKPEEIRCSVVVEKTVRACGHVLPVPCFRDVGSETFHCPTPCQKVLACGHGCPGKCSNCNGNEPGSVETHQACNKVCGRPSNTCNHTCPKPCHSGESCPPCDRPCEMKCAHSHCSLECSESCAPCIERCAWTCEHQGRCSMPCAVPCNRLPCDERCVQTLSCGHRCPGLCGEPCPDQYCQACGAKPDQRVDLLELKEYKEVDLDETPIVVLGCGHFFTAESLDGLARLSDVYSTDSTERFVGLLEPSALLPVPRCPDCNSPMRQSATMRYNRIVNAAVLDETTQRFFVKGQTEIENLERKIEAAEDKLANAPFGVGCATTPQDGTVSVDEQQQHRRLEALTILSPRYAELVSLMAECTKFRKAMSIEQQPSKKLYDAIMEARRRQPLDQQLDGLGLASTPKLIADERIVLKARLARFRIQATIITDIFRLLSSKDAGARAVPTPDKHVMSMLKDLNPFIQESNANNLPRLVILGSLIYARMAKCLQSSYKVRAEHAELVIKTIESAKETLEFSEELCHSQFEGAEQLRKDVEMAQRLLGREWYEPVTDEEIKAIKQAMVSGRHGINTHSGHWYKCPNGHTFAIGECGMPMELARCPECGSGIGGQGHTAVAGVTRAMDMEMA